MKKLHGIVSLVTVFLVLAVVAARRDSSVLGYRFGSSDIVPVEKLAEGRYVVHSSVLADDVVGYAGEVPLDIYVSDGTIDSVVPLENRETPRFFRKASAILDRYAGMAPEEVVSADIDAVTGATFSSEAIINGMKKSMAYCTASGEACGRDWRDLFSDPAVWAAVAVLLCGLYVSLFFRNRYVRMVQLVLNVVVLGLWSHTFLTYSQLVNWVSHGSGAAVSAAAVLVLVLAAVMPLFGRKEYYCMWCCPMGSLQELLSHVLPARMKLRIPERTANVLGVVREGIYAVLLVMMFAGVFFEWMDYEVFSIFLLGNSGAFVTVLASVFLILSLFVARPYCRFLCPTGTVIKHCSGHYAVAPSGKGNVNGISGRACGK